MLQFSPQRRRALKAFVLPQMTPIFPDKRKNLRSSAKSADKTPNPPLCASVPLWQKFVFIRVHSWLTPNSAPRTPHSAFFATETQRHRDLKDIEPLYADKKQANLRSSVKYAEKIPIPPLRLRAFAVNPFILRTPHSEFRI